MCEYKKFQYRMLSRLKSDCDYFLGNGNYYPGCLYYEDVVAQLEHMKKRWLSFLDDEKPEWLTWDQLMEYEKRMLKEYP